MAQMANASGNTSNNIPDQLIESLGRLSKKAGVLATIVLDRVSGTILASTGNASLSRVSIRSATSPIVNTSSIVSDEVRNGSGDANGINEIALMVWKFVDASAGIVHDIDEEDEIKLLRLRTKKYELVIVPDSKYLLVVVHETPSA